MLRFIAAIAFLFALAGARVEAATNADWRLFMDESYGEYQNANEPADFEDMLFDAGEENRTQNAAVAAFARRLGVSAGVAQTYADLIVAAVKLRETCAQSRAPSACAFGPGTALYDRVAREGLAEPTGGLLIVAGKNLSRPGGHSAASDGALIRLASTHAAASAVFRRLFGYNEKLHYLAALLSAGPLTEQAALMLAGAWGTQSEDWSGRLDALVEAVERDHSEAPARVRAGIAQFALMRKLRLGLTGDAVASYFAYPDEVRALLPLRPAACGAAQDTDCEAARELIYLVADELAAALFVEGRRQEATAMLHAWRDPAGPRSANAAQRYEALSEAIAPRLADEELFALFIEGRRAGDPPLDDAVRAGRTGGKGWLFAFRATGAALSETVAARLRGAGYGSMADFADRESLYVRDAYADAGLEHFAFLFPERFAARQAHWAGLIEAAWARREAQRAQSAAPTVTASTLAPWWTEKPLPDGVRAWRDADRPRAAPSGLNPPVAPEAVLRHQTLNGERYIVYQSSQYDLPGEIPSYGLWFARTEDGAWRAPLYLGLQQHFPYVVTPDSALPLTDGSKLRIEVQVREIDAETITFPPIGVDFKRSADGRFIEIDLAALGADRDQDGLTDIEEARLGMKLDDADTDDDGVADGRDPLPLTPYDPNAPEPLRIAAQAILSQIMGHDAGAIMVAPGLSDAATIEDMIGAAIGANATPRPRDSGIGTAFIVADPRLFAGVRTPFRLIVYSRGDLDALNRSGAPFYPPRVMHVFSSLDGKSHYVIWSASWTGGEFLARCGVAAGQCVVEHTSRWIT